MNKKPKVVILCGGTGMRLKEETEYRPKPMVEIGDRPILWHIMKIYAHYNFNDFILCLGYKGKVIKEYFFNYEIMNNDFNIELGNSKNIKIYNNNSEQNWNVTLADTGENAMTGARVKRVEKYVDGDTFMLTYGDGVADINIQELLKFHYAHGKIGTLTGIYPPSRFGELLVEKNKVLSFSEKPEVHSGLISGGFFVFKRNFFDYLWSKEDCILEKKPLEHLVRDGELMIYHHKGFWQCMDTYRDYLLLNDIWNKSSAPWKIWEG